MDDAVYKVIEVVGFSEKSWEDAAKSAVLAAAVAGVVVAGDLPGIQPVQRRAPWLRLARRWQVARVWAQRQRPIRAMHAGPSAGV